MILVNKKQKLCLYHYSVVKKSTFSQINCAASNMSLMLPVPPPTETPCRSFKSKHSYPLKLTQKVVIFFSNYRSFLLLRLSGHPISIFKCLISSTQCIAYKPSNWTILLAEITHYSNHITPYTLLHSMVKHQNGPDWIYYLRIEPQVLVEFTWIGSTGHNCGDFWSELVESVQLSLCVKPIHLEIFKGQSPNATVAFYESLPCRLHPTPQWSHQAQTCKPKAHDNLMNTIIHRITEGKRDGEYRWRRLCENEEAEGGQTKLKCDEWRVCAKQNQPYSFQSSEKGYGF